MDFDTLLGGDEWIRAGGYTLLAIGITLFIIELFVPAFGFFGFAGLAAAVIGIAQLYQSGKIQNIFVDVEVLIIIAIVGGILSLTGGIYSLKLFAQKVTTGKEAMIGKSASITEWSGTEGRVNFKGESWQAYSDEVMELQKEQIVKITDVQDLKLKIERI